MAIAGRQQAREENSLPPSNARELHRHRSVIPDDRNRGGAMLRFVGDVGIYLPDRDAIVFTALDGRLPVACRVRRSALAALGCGFQATPQELVDGFQTMRKFLERSPDHGR
jgi:hypothetical protein